MPFAGGEGTQTVLSVLDGALSIGEGFLGFLTIRESNALRVVCKEFREAVMDFPWMNSLDESRIKGSAKAWRAAFPAARGRCKGARRYCRRGLHPYSRRRACTAAQCEHDGLQRGHGCGLRAPARDPIAQHEQLRSADNHGRSLRAPARDPHARQSWCSQATITDATFVHLRGIKSLNMFCCNQATITDAALVHLRGIQMLYMSHGRQATITDAAFVPTRDSDAKNIAVQSVYHHGCDFFASARDPFARRGRLQSVYHHGCGLRAPTRYSEAQHGQLQTGNLTDAAIAQLVGIYMHNTKKCRCGVLVSAAKILDVDYESEEEDEEEVDEVGA